MNTVSKDVLNYIFFRIPLHSLITNCTLACKRWYSTIQAISVDTWKTRALREFELDTEIFDYFTARSVVYRQVRALDILMRAVDYQYQDSTIGRCIFKGLPLACQRRSLAKYIAEALVEEEIFPTTKFIEDKSLRLAISLGPFPIEEFEGVKNTWEHYVQKLLRTIGFNRDFAITRNPSQVITPLIKLLRKKTQLPIIANESSMLLFDAYQEHVDFKLRRKKKSKITESDIAIYKEPEIANICFSACLGHVVDLGSIVEHFRRPVKFKPGQFPGLKICYPNNVNILLFENGKIMIVGVRSIDQISPLWELIKKELAPFKI